jgi:glycine/D-amino acid oxidase-like deaminating enzyme
MSQAWDVIVVGAGIVGAACARACACAGMKVLVVTQGSIAEGTTGAGMGHVVILDDSEAQFALTQYSRQLWLALLPDLSAVAEAVQCGTLWVAADQEEMEEVRRKAAFYQSRGVRATQLDAQSLLQAEPNLRPDLVGGLQVCDDMVVYPPSACLTLLGQAQAHGAEVRCHAPVAHFLPEGGVVLTDGTKIPSAHAVNAAGCGAPMLTPGLPVQRRKGHLVITDRYPDYIHHQIIELGYLKSAHAVSTDSVAFNIQPRQTGQMLIGSSRQNGDESPDVDHAILTRMLKRAKWYMPNIDQLQALRCWTGFRPATPDKLPLIGPSPLQDHVWLATGHEGLGITTSLATGSLLADLILERTPEIPAEPYLPARLSTGDFKHV